MFYFSLIINIILLLFILFPLFKRKFGSIKLLKVPAIDYKEPVLKAGVLMLNSNKIFMSFNDDISLYSLLATLKNKFLLKGNNYSYFNFPRAWLMIGVLDSFEATKDKKLIDDVEKQCEILIDGNGDLLFQFNKIDQSLFGLVFIRLFDITGELKYKNASFHVYKHCQSFMNNDDLILYRKGVEVFFVDTIGMVVPFLYSFASAFDNKQALLIARRQLLFYFEKGVDPSSGIPFHAYDLKNKMLLGASNWGRGVGWYIIGLSYGLKYETDIETQNVYKAYYDILTNKLQTLKAPNKTWPQFIGHSNDNATDASATFMIYYSMMIVDDPRLNIRDVNSILENLIDINGFVEYSSGDTIYINKYSKLKGKSEVSQGLLLSLLHGLNL